MVRRFNKAEFHHGENTKTLRLGQKPTNSWSLQNIRIVNLQKVFRFVHFLGSFPSKRTKMFFQKKHMHSSTQISHYFYTQVLFLMKIQKFKSDCQDFDFLLFLEIKSDSNQYLGKIRFFFENGRSRDDQLITSGMSKVMVEAFSYTKMSLYGQQIDQYHLLISFLAIALPINLCFMIVRENWVFKINNLWCRLKF